MFANKIRGDLDKKKEVNMFKLCLQPILRWMSFIGLYSEKQHTFGIGHVIRRWTIYLSLIAILCVYIVRMLVWEFEITPWADFVDASVLAFYIIGINTSNLFLTRPETWASLISSFQMHLPYTMGINLKLGKFSILAVSYIVISSGIFLGLYLPIMISYGPDYYISTSLYILVVFSRIYPNTAFMFFCVLLLSISIELKDIRCRLLNRQARTTCNELKSLKCQHAMICRTVAKINQIFGYTVLVEVVTVFIGTVANIMYFMPGFFKDFPRPTWALYYAILYYLDQIFHFGLLTIVADRIPKENMKIYYTLTEVENLRDGLLEDEIQRICSSFETQVFRMSPQIEAAGIFTVSKRLFPSFIGSTLTYFFILMGYSKPTQIGITNFNFNATNSSSKNDF